MNKSYERQLIDTIKELEVVEACSQESGSDIPIRLHCYRDTLVQYRRYNLSSAKVSPCKLGWAVLIGDCTFLVRKVDRLEASGYETYIQHSSDQDYYKLIDTKIFPELNEAVDYLQSKYKEGVY